ncbi:MAG: YbjN domain-containing protein [Verrucomicrobiota bacterium]
MATLFQFVTDAFTKANWAFRPVHGRDVIEAEFEAHHGKVFLHVQAFGEIGAVSVVAESQEAFGAESKMALSELLMRTNRALSIGAFEMDWDRGQVSFRASNVFAPGEASHEIIASLVRTTVVEMDRLTPLLAIVKSKAGQFVDVQALLAREDLLPGEPGSGLD